MYRFLLCIWMLLPLSLVAQVDSVLPQAIPPQAYLKQFSDSMSKQNTLRADSMKRIGDSLAMVHIGFPDPQRPNRFVDSLVRVYEVKNLDWMAWAAKFIRMHSNEGLGKPRNTAQPWIIWTILALILGFASIRIAFRNEVSMLVNAFFDHRFLAQQSFSGSFFNSWPFILLFILFGFTIGMYVFLIGRYLQLSYAFEGFRWYISLSVLSMFLLVAKVYILRFLGSLLLVQKVVKAYISILFLSYFHAALLFLPLIFAFSLSSVGLATLFIYMGMAITAFIIVFQAFRVGIHVLSHYQFPKFYLFLYFCALEICPLLILVKALRF